MFINQIVNYCSSNYVDKRDKRCNGCQNDCSGSCKNCLHNIFWGKKIQRYNCSNIVNFYVCRYIYRFASEIEYILNKVYSFNLLKRLDILSIGCGPSTDHYCYLFQ